VDVPASPAELVRPWRTATIVVSAVAAVELVALLGLGVFVLAKPLSRAIRSQAEATALAPARQALAPPPTTARRTTSSSPAPKLARHRTSVMVLNGNGRSGAAAQGAARLRGFGYVIAGTGNARRSDYATTVVMYKPGFRAEGLRLAHDLKAKVVGPLDGVAPATMMGGQLAVVIGA
jgi:LytR cell envelope-related transcriptional attenuator